jgi:hypothetical protein
MLGLTWFDGPSWEMKRAAAFCTRFIVSSIDLGRPAIDELQ